MVKIVHEGFAEPPQVASLESYGEALGLSGDELAPLMAGARVGGMADAFELLGLAAVFLDCEGSVLHVGTSAGRFFGPNLAIGERRMFAARPQTNAPLQALIASVLANEAGGDAAILRFGEGMAPLRVHALTVPGAANDPHQLLKAILILDDGNCAQASETAALAHQVAACGRRGN